jgi:hypothetical protein
VPSFVCCSEDFYVFLRLKERREQEAARSLKNFCSSRRRCSSAFRFSSEAPSRDKFNFMSENVAQRAEEEAKTFSVCFADVRNANEFLHSSPLGGVGLAAGVTRRQPIRLPM